ncbi:MAG: flagellar biosynthetic protein FliR [Candidatus Hydrogenedentes bacterium]|nr:flagellar biosynthetic protein FliR [Candidatus Hydrogenedentota bacterium]
MQIFEVEVFKLFIIVAARVSGLIVAAPVLGSRNYPVIAKVGLVSFIAILIAPTLPAFDQTLPSDPIAFTIIGAGEFLIGLIMGFVMTILFSAIQIGGQIVDMQTGFSLMNIFNPALETQFPIFGFFFFIVAVLYFFTLNMHHLMLTALAASFEQLPPGGFTLHPELMLEVQRWGNAMFLDGLLIAAPVAAAMFLAYVTMGLLGRVVPQIHLLVIGFPITISVGLFLVAFSITLYLGLLDNLFHQMFKNVEVTIRGMS